MENAVGFLRQWIIIWFGNRGLMCLVPPVPWGGTGGVWWLFRFGLVGLVVGVGGFASHVGAFEFEVTGGSGDAAEGAVGDEFAADAHVPLLGFALAGDERGSRAVAGLHDLEDEDAVGGGDRGGQEVVEDEQFHGLELVDLAVVLALAFQSCPVDLLEHVLQSDVACGYALPAGRVAEGLADVVLPDPVLDMMIRVSRSRIH